MLATAAEEELSRYLFACGVGLVEELPEAFVVVYWCHRAYWVLCRRRCD
jgi:hypothetical protein